MKKEIKLFKKMKEEINLKNNSILTILISFGIATFLFFFFTNEQFFVWAFSRHQNILSWAVRPLLMLPFCYFAYKKNLNGILLTVLAILTSMFWFPVPAEINPQVMEFLNMEKEYLTSDFNVIKAISLVGIIAFLVLLAYSFWNRSVKMGLGIAISGAVLKSLWSIWESPDGGRATIPFAIGGFIVLLVAVFLYRKFEMKK